ncbi:putative disease resistance protein At3g15700 [Mangifera indica]|uniref:putative disease resistance protein At3g15700 n=1 Tax=Mangifera indica TaxID=29780 RepID=UPI001CFA23EF|nr:putative disease resistance protein At3g15700 [Mangifera indica]
MVDVAGNLRGAVSPVLQLAEWLAAPICRQFKYLFNYTTNFKNLEMEVDKLKNTREEVERKIIAAERNVEVINQNVKKWQDSAQKMIDKAEQLIQEKANNPRCFRGLCSNFIIHYKQSKRAFKLKRDDIDPLLQQERELSPISYQTNPPEIWLRSSENYLAFESRNSTLKNVWDALNDENVFMIGVYGMGGLGKTTLVQEVGRKAKAEKLFDDIVFVEVSESPDIKKIQTAVADNLGLKFESESERAKKLYSRMEGKNILLIIDNIWEPLEFEKTIGIPCGADRGRNKLLFTTRNLDVLESMGSTNNFGMGILNEEEAWTLFTKMTALTDNVIQIDRLHSLPNDVCKECAGLPIVICTIGRALIKKTEPFDWKDVLQELRAPSPTNFTELLKEEYRKIELSYRYLRNDELKKTFLIASLLENNTSISDLIKHVVGQDILEGANLTMENTRNRLDRVVRELKYACLLLDGVEDGQFAMHDVVRVVAITIANVNHHVFTARNDVERDWKDKDKLKKCTKISLPSKNTIISQLWPNDLDCPSLEYFYMTDMRNSSFEISEGFFMVMPKLRVLNLVGLQQSSLPSSIHHLTNLQTLCLDKSNIEGVTIIGKLKKLKVLSL